MRVGRGCGNERKRGSGRVAGEERRKGGGFEAYKPRVTAATIDASLRTIPKLIQETREPGCQVVANPGLEPLSLRVGSAVCVLLAVVLSVEEEEVCKAISAVARHGRLPHGSPVAPSTLSHRYVAFWHFSAADPLFALCSSFLRLVTTFYLLFYFSTFLENRFC
jgi:hypothetical protein